MTKQRKNAILAFEKKSVRRSLSGRRLVVESLEPRTMMSAVPHFSQMVVFGASLSDTGNTSPLLAPLERAMGVRPTNGRFTSDPTSSPPSAGTGVWAEVLANELGIASPAPSRLGGTNFAVGGADSGSGDGTLFGLVKNIAIPNVGKQVSNYLSRASDIADSNALYSIWAGFNDLLDQTSFGRGRAAPNVHAFENTAITAANQLETDITTLAQRGAKYFIWPNLPEIDSAPKATTENWSAATKAAMADAVQTFNNAWSADIQYVHAHYPKVAIYAFDVHTLFNEMLQGTYPGYRFSDTTHSASASPSAASADTFLFWDSIHPTEMAHRLLGEAAYNLIASSPSVNAYSATPTASMQGTSVQVHWTVSDPSGSGLNLVELWRAPDAGGVPGNWGTSPVQWEYVSGTVPDSGSFADAPSSGKWWYDVMVIDVNGLYRDAAPTEVAVHAPGASSALHLMAATPHQTQDVSLAAVDAVMAAYGRE